MNLHVGLSGNGNGNGGSNSFFEAHPRLWYKVESSGMSVIV
jgi:hypothetical protein